MSPRAAWRLQALGYADVHDYAAGKSDWMAAGLPTEGTASGRPRVTDVMDRSPATCGPSETVAEVQARVGPAGTRLCVVVNAQRVVLGRLRTDRLGTGDTRAVEEVMERGPATIRADADPAETFERMRRHGATSLIVSTPEGVLLGVVHATEGVVT